MRVSSTLRFLPGSMATVLLAVLMSTSGLTPVALAQGTGKASKPYIGSAMAVLATMEQAGVLPPENTPDANLIIKSVIQFQSAFTKSDDPAIRDFSMQAVTTKFGPRSSDLIAELQSTGWTAPVLEALADAEMAVSKEELQTLSPGFGRFNLTTADFHRFMGLVRRTRLALEQRGLQFDRVYASHRRTMPGANTVQ